MTASYIVSMLSIAVLGKILHFVLTKSWNDERRSEEPKYLNHALFFPDADFPCSKLVSGISKSPGGIDNQKLCANPSCARLHNRPGERPSSLIKFVEFLAQSEKTIDVCVYLFTQGSLSDLLVALKSRTGVHIRLITDSTEDDSQASQIERLRSAGIEIRSNKRGTGALMHHKFVIVDNKTLLSGSFNWTNKAVVSNYEAVIVSTDPSLVRPFCQEFEVLWSKFKWHPTRSRRSAR